MSAILHIEEVNIGKLMIIIPKIREVHVGLGNVVIVYDNGDRRTIDTTDASTTMKEVISQIEKYYEECKNV